MWCADISINIYALVISSEETQLKVLIKWMWLFSVEDEASLSMQHHNYLVFMPRPR